MKLLVVDDHPLVRQGLLALLRKNNDEVREASSIAEASESIASYQPDLVLVDLRLGKESGFQLIKDAGKFGNSIKFVILTSSARISDFKTAKELGVSGYILKEALPEELLYALKLVSNGRKYYDPGVLEVMMDEEETENVEGLTKKEQEVLRLLGMGGSNRDIAGQLFISENTVKKHVSQILDKLHLPDRTQAALYANLKGISTYQLVEQNVQG
ncbi:response regulator transcription factor [Halobacillus litoralis]|uniref:response regulator transcription factor n=1 Tax=Halobacillus litoralis TaxID=45668 RepID=UPI001CD6B12F|nr:response regulator transcription factor [Halobacillus litoralis]MCA0971758.1 response regulator transcription factor [Halobacillus litoralis]